MAGNAYPTGLGRFVRSLFSAFGALFLIVSRRRVLIFTLDTVDANRDRCDNRMEGIYAHLRQEKQRYFEIVQTVLGQNWLRNALRRRRLVFFADPRTIAFYRKWLKFSSIQTLLSVDDIRSALPLWLAARELGIETHAFQHDLYTRPQPETPVPDRWLVWSDYWKRELLRLNPTLSGERVLSAGRAFSGPATLKGAARGHGSELTIVIPHEADANAPLVAAFVRKLLTMKQVRVLFRVHREKPAASQLADYGLVGVPRIEVITELDPQRRIDLAIGTYSHFLYEMIERGIPVGVLTHGSEQGQGLVRNGLAEALDAETITEADLELIARQDAGARRAKIQTLLGADTPDLGRTLRKIVSGKQEALKLLACQNTLA